MNSDRPKPVRSLKVRAVDLLSRREYTRLELKRRLAPFAESAEELETLLDSLAANLWQSDSRFAEQFATARGRKYGSLRIAQEMRERGVERELIKETLAAQDDLTTAREIWQRKFGEAPADQKERLKQTRFLASRGFSAEVIRKVLQGLPDEEY